MAELIYSAIASLDGFTADEQGGFDWAAPGEEVHRFINDLERPIGTYLYGRRMYEVMSTWQSVDPHGIRSPAVRDFAQIWQAADKIVYSTSLADAPTARTRVEPRFEADAVRQLKEAAERDLTIGGATLAAEAFAAGLVDECHLFLTPILVGGGTRALAQGVRADLELVAARSFGSGVVYLRYRLVR